MTKPSEVQKAANSIPLDKGRTRLNLSKARTAYEQRQVADARRVLAEGRRDLYRRMFGTEPPERAA